jgi:hypothetical protein
VILHPLSFQLSSSEYLLQSQLLALSLAKMTSKKSNATKAKDKLSNSTLVQSSQDGAQAVEASPEVNAGDDQEMKTTSNISDLETAVTVSSWYRLKVSWRANLFFTEYGHYAQWFGVDA